MKPWFHLEWPCNQLKDHIFFRLPVVTIWSYSLSANVVWDFCEIFFKGKDCSTISPLLLLLCLKCSWYRYKL
jgi:hypothetical protein